MKTMLRFLTGSAIDRGYVPVNLPEVFGEQAVACLYRSDRKGTAVMKLSETVCCKMGPKNVLDKEVEVLKSCGNFCVQVFALLCSNLEETRCEAYPYGFRLELCDSLVAAVLEEEVKLEHGLASLFWAFKILHEHGIVHNDVKPRNMLVTQKNQIVLCDAGSAFRVEEDWSHMPRGCTKAFSVTKKFSRLTEGNPKMWDMEGLLWSGLYLFACSLKEGAISYSSWDEKRFSWLSNPPKVPESVVLQKYFLCADERVLAHPSGCWKVLAEESEKIPDGMDELGYLTAVQMREGFFPCPQSLLLLLRK